ncbi:9 [Durusdinium trenchii]|uniref:11-endoperoxide prostaglandin H2 reductase (Prostaglandin F2-alpha synthase) n=1 Tax=Durusdinium trenchii TaxID=1381693 RepID=A0ABP0PWX3_9DINO
MHVPTPRRRCSIVLTALAALLALGARRAPAAVHAPAEWGRLEVQWQEVWPANYGYEKAIDSVKESAQKLGLEYIDLVLPHWPGVSTAIEEAEQNALLRKQTWKALESLKKDGLVKQIGISNYNERHLGELLDYAELRPSASQFEIHPFNTREKLVKRCQDLGIRVNGYSPLGGKGNPNQVTDLLLQSPYLEDLGKQYGKTPAQIILRWHLQRDTTPIPKASTKSRLAENFNVFDFQLKEEEMATISSFDRKRFAVLNSEVFL